MKDKKVFFSFILLDLKNWLLKVSMLSRKIDKIESGNGDERRWTGIDFTQRLIYIIIKENTL